MPAQGNALIQLRQFRIEEQLAQLRLADEDDVQQLLGFRLEIQQQTDLFKQLRRQGLRLIEDQHAQAAGIMLRDQIRVELLDQSVLAVLLDRQAEFAANSAQQLGRGQWRHQAIRRVDVRPELRQKAAE